MSDILIRGMEMPKICGQCQIELGIDCELWRHVRSVSLDRHKDCPLIPVQPHGRLIDVNALWVEINKICDRRDAGIISDLTCLQQLLSAVRHAPTIIQAEPLNEEVNE